jgi:hypothetical protein
LHIPLMKSVSWPRHYTLGTQLMISHRYVVFAHKYILNIVCLILIKFWFHFFPWFSFIKQVENDDSDDEKSYGTTPRTDFQNYIRLKRSGMFCIDLSFELFLVVFFFGTLSLQWKMSVVFLWMNVSYFNVFIQSLFIS